MSMQYNMVLYKALEPALAELPPVARGLACGVISSGQMCLASQQSLLACVEHWADSLGRVDIPAAQPKVPVWFLACQHQ